MSAPIDRIHSPATEEVGAPLARAPLTTRKPSPLTGNKNAVRLNPRVRAAIAHRLANPGATWSECCTAAGCPERTFYKARKSAHFAEHFKQLGRDKLLVDILPHAIERYEGLIRKSESEYVAADLAKDAMAQAGVRVTPDGAGRPSATGGVSIRFVTVDAQGGAQAVQVDVQPAQSHEKSDG